MQMSDRCPLFSPFLQNNCGLTLDYFIYIHDLLKISKALYDESQILNTVIHILIHRNITLFCFCKSDTTGKF